MTERITSARDLSRYLTERFRRDGFFRGPRFVDKGELIIPLSATLCPALERLRQGCVKSATLSRHDSDVVASFARLNCNTDDWRELTDVAVNAERKANRARERALKRSLRNTKNPKKKGKCR